MHMFGCVSNCGNQCWRPRLASRTDELPPTQSNRSVAKMFEVQTLCSVNLAASQRGYQRATFQRDRLEIPPPLRIFGFSDLQKRRHEVNHMP